MLYPLVLAHHTIYQSDKAVLRCALKDLDSVYTHQNTPFLHICTVLVDSWFLVSGCVLI